MPETQEVIIRVLTESELQQLTSDIDATQKAMAKMAAEGDTASDEYNKLTAAAKKLDAELRAHTKATEAATSAQKQNNDETQKTEKTQTSLKARLREIRNELNAMAEAGDTSSAAFLNLQREAGDLQDTIGDVSGRIRAMSSDTKAIDSVVGGIGLLANSFAAAQAATSLFTKDNEKLAEQFMKVQQALALATSVQQIANALNKDSALVTNLHAAAVRAYNWAVVSATGATRALRVAMATLGIGAIVAAVGYLVTKLFEYEEATNDAATAAEKMAAAQEKLDASFSNINANIDITILRLKARGASQAELDAAIIRGANEIIRTSNAQMTAYTNDRKKEVEDEIKTRAGGDKILEGQLRAQEKLTGEIMASRLEATKEIRYKIETEKLNAEIQITDIENKAELERRENAKKNAAERARDMAEMEKLKQASIRNMLLMDLNGLEKELEIIDNSFEEKLAAAKGNEELTTILLMELRKTRLAKLDEYNKKEIEDNEKKCAEELQNEKQKNAAILEARMNAYNAERDAGRALRDFNAEQIQNERERRQQQYANELEDLQNAKLNELNAAIESDAYRNATEAEQREILDGINESYRNKNILAQQKYSSDVVEIRRREAEQSLQTQQFYADALRGTMEGLMQMLDGFGKSGEERERKRFETQKKLAIAMALIDTYLAAQKAYLSQMQLTPDSPVRAAIAAGVAVVAGLGRVAQINKQTFNSPSDSGGAGGGGGAAMTGGGTGNNNLPSPGALRPSGTQLDANGRPIIPGGGMGNNTPPPLRAYVVENDIRTTTRRLDTIQQNARL